MISRPVAPRSRFAPRRARKAAAIVLSMVALAACGLAAPDRSGVSISPPPTAAPAAAAPPTSAAPAAAATTITGAATDLPLYFVRDGKLGVARRPFAVDTTLADRALAALLAGPTPAEQKAGLTSAIPTLSRIRGTKLMGDVFVVDLAGSFAALGPQFSGQQRVAQIVYTLTVFPVKVLFQIDGQPARAVGGFLLPDHPLTRDDLVDWAPPILLESIGPDEVLTPATVISGSTASANTNVGVRVTNGAGQVLFEGSTRSEDGRGPRHSFTTSALFPAPAPGPGTLTLWDATPGVTPLVITVPVQLA
jgi:hypothetical protein